MRFIHALQWTLAQIRYRFSSVLANVTLLAVSMVVVTAVQLSPTVMDTKAQSDVGKIDLVLAGKGSPLQWVMAAVYQLDNAPSNVNAQSVQNLLTEPAIQTHIASKVTIAMGDSVNGARLIGVDSIPAYLAFFDAKLNAGIIRSQAMQAVVGASVARRLNLSLGSPFYSTHGLEPGGSSHDDSPYSVTGILQPTGTVLDTLILTPIDSIWVAHEGKPRDFEEAQLLAQARDISAVLVQYRYPISAVALPALLEKTAPANMTVAAVAPQMQRLWLLFEPFYQLFLALSIVIAAFSAVSLILTARLTQGQRLHDLGILRMLGAKTGQLCGLLALESLLYWIAASALFLAIFLTAGVLVSNTIHLPYLQLVLMATPTAFIVMCLTLFLLLIAAALTGWRLLKQTPAAVLQER